KGEDDKPTLVPPLILERPIEVRRFVEAIYRKKYKQNYQANLREIKKDWENQDNHSILEKERCVDQSKTLKQEFDSELNFHNPTHNLEGNQKLTVYINTDRKHANL